jgi:hypothetical protein
LKRFEKRREEERRRGREKREKLPLAPNPTQSLFWSPEPNRRF